MDEQSEVPKIEREVDPQIPGIIVLNSLIELTIVIIIFQILRAFPMGPIETTWASVVNLIVLIALIVSIIKFRLVFNKPDDHKPNMIWKIVIEIVAIIVLVLVRSID